MGVEFSLFLVLSIVSFLAIGASGLYNCEYIHKCNVCTLDGKLVKVRRDVDTINIFELNITSIDENNTFEDIVAIKLSFSIGNNISSVKKESFKGLELLRELDLGNNMIPLSPYLFSELKQLRTLNNVIASNCSTTIRFRDCLRWVCFNWTITESLI